MDSSITAAELERELKAKQIKFCEAYIALDNGTRAAQAAGYSPENEKSAATTANRLLRNEKIASYIRARTREILEQSGLDASGIKARLVEVYKRSMQAKPHLSWSTEEHAYVPDGTWIFDAKNALRALELMGKTLGIFEEHITVDTPSVEDYLKKLERDGEEP